MSGWRGGELVVDPQMIFTWHDIDIAVMKLHALLGLLICTVQ